MTHREVIRDPDTGEILMAACVDRPFTDDERAAMVELARYVNAKHAEDHPDDPDGAKLGERQQAKTREIRERGRARLAEAPQRTCWCYVPGHVGDPCPLHSRPRSREAPP